MALGAIVLLAAGCGQASKAPTATTARTASTTTRPAATKTGTATTSTRATTTPRSNAPDAVAVAAGTPITHATFVHWMFVAAKSQSQTGQTVIVPTDPPAFKGCVAQARRSIPSFARKPVLAVRADCEQLFRSMSAEVMDFLIKANWYEADAARLGIDPSSAEVDNAFNTEKDKTFPTAAGFRAFLAKTGQTVADVHFRVRINEVVKRLVAREKGSQTARQNVVDSEVKKLYQPTTTCTPSVAIADCGS
jgi:hypothetical protein